MVGTAGAAVAEPGREDTAKEKGPPAPRQPGGELGFEPADGVAMGGFWAGGVTCSGVSEPPRLLHSQGEPQTPLHQCSQETTAAPRRLCADVGG